MLNGKIRKALWLCFLMLLGTPLAWFWDNPVFKGAQGVSCNAADTSLDWIGLAFLALLMGIMINAGAWALSGVLSTPKYQDFLKGTLWSFLEGLALLAVLAGATGGLQHFGEDNINTARAYSVIIRNTVIGDFAMMLGANVMLSLFTSVNPTFRPFGARLGIFISLQVAPMFRPIYDTLGLMMQLLVTSIAQWFGHEFLLCIVKDSLLIILLPAGIFLRAYGLKGGGNALIGVALALYFVYPFMLVLVGQVVTAHVQASLGSGAGVLGFMPCPDKPICCMGNTQLQNNNEPYIQNGPNEQLAVRSVLDGAIYLSPSGSGLGATCAYNTVLAPAYGKLHDAFSNLEVGNIAGLAAGGTASYLLVKFLNLSVFSIALMPALVAFTLLAVYNAVYFLFIVSVLLPIFVIFITITIAKEIAKVLGTEIDLSALEKLI